MYWYPWLTKIYKQIIWQHQQDKAHHAVLINTCRGIGVLNLFWAITRWILCTQKKDIKSCGICHNCNLITSNNHPDWYFIQTDIGKKLLGIDSIRNIIQKIFYTAQQGRSKIIWLPEISLITEAALCSLLKTLEEPPQNTWFFLVNYDSFKIPETILSRCLKYSLFPPTENNSMYWLEKTIDKQKLSCLTALRMSAGSPITAKKLLTGSLWLDRKLLFKKLEYAIKNYNLFSLLSFFIKKSIYIIFYINWICMLLFDAIKWKYQLLSSLIHLDHISLIKNISQNYSISFLHESIDLWIQCKRKLRDITGINYELLLVENLLAWEEKIISYNKKLSKREKICF